MIKMITFTKVNIKVTPTESMTRLEAIGLDSIIKECYRSDATIYIAGNSYASLSLTEVVNNIYGEPRAPFADVNVAGGATETMQLDHIILSDKSREPYAIAYDADDNEIVIKIEKDGY